MSRNASEINNLDADYIFDKCTNSVFKDQDDILISEYGRFGQIGGISAVNDVF